MDVGPPMLPRRRRRARPIADAPVDELLVYAEELTKGWLLALVEDIPLAQAPSILTVDVARDGPRVCEAILRAIASDTDLRRLQPGGALEMLVSSTGRLAGAVDPEATSRAVDALAAVIWSALHDSLQRPEPDDVAALHERLEVVMELVRQAALRASGAGSPPRESARPGESGPIGADSPIRQSPGEAADAEEATPEDEASLGGPVEQQGGPASARRGELKLADGDRPETASPAADTRAGAQAGDAQDLSPGPLWIGAVKDEIARAHSAHAALSLLLVELEDAERIRTLEQDADTGTFGHFARAVRSVLRRQDILASESETRAWIIAPDTGRLGARTLGARIVAAVRAAPPWQGAPLAASVGLAVLAEDGRDPESLIEAAEESRFAAEASGVGLEGERQSGDGEGSERGD